MLLVVDNGSSSTKDIIDAVDSNGVDFESAQYTKIGSNLDRFDSFILSGRRRRDYTTNVANSRIIRHCVAQEKPLLGICYGAEILALTMGGTLKVSSHRESIYDVAVSDLNPISYGTLSVFGKHRLEIARLPDTVLCLASSSACRYEMIQLQNSKIFGTQFHPELTHDGRMLMEQFLKL